MDWIKKQAMLYRNLSFTNRYQAIVHLEDKEDEMFWDYQLQSVKPGRFRYLYYSKNNNGTDTRGCEQCLRFRSYLTDRFFICIDSDLRLLKGEEGLTASNHIAQTYTYSWENHLCESTHVYELMKENLPQVDFDMNEFMANFSKIVYMPLLYLVSYSANSELNKLWNISKFNACIPLQPKRSDLDDNGKVYLTTIKARFDMELEKLTKQPIYKIASVTDGNAYLHIQGHLLYKMMLHVGTLLCRGTGIAFKTDILDKCLHTYGYDEIESLQKDLKDILKSKKINDNNERTTK